MNWILLGVLMLLQFGDWYTTKTVLAQGGRELNPVMNWIFNKIGFTGGMIAKCVYVFALGYILATLGSMGSIVLGILIALYSWVVWHNYRQFN